ncbi:MAG TPA: hypothetical protein VN181_03470 [Thermoanaerobaculia bacterium]|nr:hypothetical protein [Thermoanaerobaculia bacterium]
MNRAWNCLGTALAMLCLAFGAIAANAEEIPVNVVAIENENWRSNLAIVAANDAVSMRVSDCGQFSQYTVNLPAGGSHLSEDFTRSLCSGTKLGIVSLRVLSGHPSVWTEASFRDARGVRNAVDIPALGEPLPASTLSGSYQYVFRRIENEPPLGKSTWFAFFTSGGSNHALVTIDVYDGRGVHVATESIAVDGFSFYELATSIKIGRVEVRQNAGSTGPITPTRLFAICFVNYREGGGPRVELPDLETRVALPATTE